MFKLSVELKHKTCHGLITTVDQDPWQLKARSENQSRQNSGLERMSSTDPQGLWPQRRLRLIGSALGAENPCITVPSDLVERLEKWGWKGTPQGSKGQLLFPGRTWDKWVTSKLAPVQNFVPADGVEGEGYTLPAMAVGGSMEIAVVYELQLEAA